MLLPLLFTAPYFHERINGTAWADAIAKVHIILLIYINKVKIITFLGLNARIVYTSSLCINGRLHIKVTFMPAKRQKVPC